MTPGVWIVLAAVLAVGFLIGILVGATAAELAEWRRDQREHERDRSEKRGAGEAWLFPSRAPRNGDLLADDEEPVG